MKNVSLPVPVCSPSASAKENVRESVEELKKSWRASRAQFAARLAEFRRVWREGSDEELFAELAFCLFTPQSKAKSCWKAVETLHRKKLLFTGAPGRLSCELNTVRFRNNKARYLVLARAQFSKSGKVALRPQLAAFASAAAAREWLVRNVKGLGYKEASHFLRNIGLGERIAILDRHILKNLRRAGVIEEIPSTMTPRRYRDIEKKMEAFARRTGIPLAHVDLLLWSRETGEIFK